MDRQAQLELLRTVMADVLATDPERVTEESRFREDLDADSLDMLEIVSAVEDRLGVRLADEELKQARTVADALDLVTEAQRVSTSEV